MYSSYRESKETDRVFISKFLVLSKSLSDSKCSVGGWSAYYLQKQDWMRRCTLIACDKAFIEQPIDDLLHILRQRVAGTLIHSRLIYFSRRHVSRLYHSKRFSLHVTSGSMSYGKTCRHDGKEAFLDW